MKFSRVFVSPIEFGAHRARKLSRENGEIYKKPTRALAAVRVVHVREISAPAHDIKSFPNMKKHKIKSRKREMHRGALCPKSSQTRDFMGRAVVLLGSR